jgi:hypothetical protein
MTALDRALERIYGEEVARLARVFATGLRAGTYTRGVDEDGNDDTMRLALAIEQLPAFKRLSFRRRVLILAGAPNLSAALRSETTDGADDEVFALTSWCLAAGVLAGVPAPSPKRRRTRSAA